MFKQIPASKTSIARRKSVYGVGLNDADYQVAPHINGKRCRCPFYERWRNMLKRCYCVKFQDRFPSYKGCTATSDWLVFSNFKLWMVKQNWEGKHLDKDILVQGNKIYSPELCLFVTREINNLFTEKKSNVGAYPTGIFFCKKYKKFSAQLSVNGKRKRIGYFLSSTQAFKEYKSAKYAHIKQIASHQEEPLKSALLAHVIE